MLFAKLRSQLKLLLYKIDNFIDSHVELALKITTALKNALSSLPANLLADILPAAIDDATRQKIIAALDRVTEALAIADNCKGYTDTNDKLNCFIQQLKLRNPELQDAVLVKFASLLAGNLDGQRQKQNVYDLYTQAKYSASKPAA